MGSYSGDDSVDVYLNVYLYKSSNCLLNSFEETKKEKTVDVWLGENKIDKFYFHDLDIDLAAQTDEALFKYLSNFYNKEEEENVIEEAELSVDYHVSGYYDPGRTYGPPEDCYPPEGDEERNVEGATLVFTKDVLLEIPKEHLGKIQDAFDDEINRKDFDPPDYEPDYDYDERY